MTFSFPVEHLQSASLSHRSSSSNTRAAAATTTTAATATSRHNSRAAPSGRIVWCLLVAASAVCARAGAAAASRLQIVPDGPYNSARTAQVRRRPIRGSDLAARPPRALSRP